MEITLLIFVIASTLLPGLAWLIFFLKEDVHPEPKRLIAYTFGLGILVCIPVLLFQLLGQPLLSKISGGLALSVLFLALVEEVFKFLAAYWAVGKSSELDEPVDPMIYMIVAALGLATIENFFIIAGIMKIGGYAVFSEIANVTVLRFVGATFLHALASGLLGFYWARGRMKGQPVKFIFIGIIVATLVHSIFNYLVLLYQDLNLLLYSSLFLIVLAIFLFKDFWKLQSTANK